MSINPNKPLLPRDISCEQCGKYFSKFGIKGHIWRVHGEGISFKPGMSGKQGWNKGLTGKTDKRVKKMGETLHAQFDKGNIKVWSEGLTKETDQRIAEQSQKTTITVNQKIVNGEWHNSFSHSRTYLYKGEKFDGTWELELAKWFDSNDIKWERNKRIFPYVFDGKQRNYTPDFYLPEKCYYIEVKGWKTPKDKAKWEQFPKTEKLVIMRGKDLLELGLKLMVKKQVDF
jgi:hypothetical protein